MATHTFADVVAAPNFLDGNITTRYGSSAAQKVVIEKKNGQTTQDNI